MKINKTNVQKILCQFSATKKNPPKTPEGNLDVEAYNKLPEVIRCKKLLAGQGVTSRAQLMKMGFIPASMILTF